MINVSNEFKQVISEGNRTFYAGAEVTLKDGTKFTLDNDKIRILEIEDATSQQGQFTIGSAIVNELTLAFNNLDDEYSDYDFTDAVIRPTVGLQLSGSIETLNKGVFTADDPKVQSSVITLTALDNMIKFDKPFKGVTQAFPCTAGTLLQTVCTYCGVVLGTSTFTNSDFTIQSRPLDDAVTCREIVSWIAQLAGCFARINTSGSLELKWYDNVFEDESHYDGGKFDTSTPYSTGDSLDGGTFTFLDGATADGGDFTTQNRYHHVYSMPSVPSIATDDVVITGISVSDVAETPNTVLYGQTGYVISIEKNPLIQSSTDAQAIANFVGTKLVGMRFRPMSLSTRSNPTIEAGDVGYVSTRNGVYQTLFTNVIFGVGQSTKLTCDAQSPIRNSATRFSAATKAIVQGRKSAADAEARAKAYADELSDALLDDLNDTNAAVSDLNTTITTTVADNNLIESEKASIRLQLNILEKEKLESDNEYSVLYNDANLTGAPKTNLLNAYTDAFGTGGKYSLLITTVNNILSAATVAQLNTAVTAYNTAYGNYKTSVKTYVLSIDNAALAIGYKYADLKITAYDLMVQQLNNLVSHSFGVYKTADPQEDGSLIYYLHDKPTLAESMKIWKQTADAFAISTDGGATYTAGFDAQGNAVFNILSAIGINADWIRTGKLYSTDGKTLIDLAYGVANEDNVGETDNVQSGFPLSLSFNIGDSVSKIDKVLLQYTQKKFRTYSTGTYSGGGDYVTSGSGGGYNGQTSDVAQGTAVAMHTSSEGTTGTTSSHSHSYSIISGIHETINPTHNHSIYTPDHSHSVSISSHSHSLNFGIQETPVTSNAIDIYVDGTLRKSIDAAQGIEDLTQWITTTGWHTVELRSTTLKRISAQVKIKSYITM